jgi:hypothetical protein
MKTLDRIPTGKIERAGKLVKTGVKIGGNYAKYYSKKLVNPDLNKDELNEDNASDICRKILIVPVFGSSAFCSLGQKNL